MSKLIKKFQNPSGRIEPEMYTIIEDDLEIEPTEIIEIDEPKFIEIEDEYLPMIINKSTDKSIIDWREHHNNGSLRKPIVDKYALWMNARGDLINKNLNEYYNANASKEITNNLAGRWLSNADNTKENYVDVDKFQEDSFAETGRRILNSDKYNNKQVNGLFLSNEDRSEIFYPIRRDENTGRVEPISKDTMLEENIHSAKATGLEQTALKMIDEDVAKLLGLDINNRQNWSSEDVNKFNKAKDPYYSKGAEFYAKRTKAGIKYGMDPRKRNWSEQELEKIYKLNPNDEYFNLFFGPNAIYSKDLLKKSFNELANNDSVLLPDVYKAKCGKKLIKRNKK